MRAFVKFTLLFSVALFGYTSAEGETCGLPAPDPKKTCVSIRLPWSARPMYFCVDKAKFKYRNQCQNRFQTYCGNDNLKETLMVAVPWDCCPMVSNPDTCANQHCPAPPLNRTCESIEPNPNQPWECCPSFFCEENATPETCHYSRLEPTCNMPPEGKSNCVAFTDTFGCCPKFQCDGDGRPGQCPAEMRAMKFMARINTTTVSKPDPGHPQKEPGTDGTSSKESDAIASEIAQASAEDSGGAGFASGQMMKFRMPGPIYGNKNQMACVGDFNCPGTMKCCSREMEVYVQDNRYMKRSNNPTNGFCMEPATDLAKSI